MLTIWHPPHHRLTHKVEMRKLYWSRFALSLSGGLVSIFTPIFLLQKDTSFKELLYFYILLAIANIILSPLAFKLMTIIGSNINMFLAAGIQGLVYVLLSMYAGPGALLVVIALLSALANELYWPAFHANFSLAEDGEHAGKQVSFLTIVSGLAQATTPLIGGIFAYFFGINVLYIPAALLLVLGSLPLLTHQNKLKEVHFSIRKVGRKIFSTDMMAVFGSSVVGMAEQVAWPVAIFLILGNLALIGGLSTLMLASGVVIAVYVGRRIHDKGAKHFVNLSAPMIGLTNILRIFVSGVPAISGANFVGGMAHSVNGTAYTTALYKNAGKSHRLSYLFAAEVTWWSGWLVVLCIMLITFAITDSSRTALVAALVSATVGSLLIRKIR